MQDDHTFQLIKHDPSKKKMWVQIWGLYAAVLTDTKKEDPCLHELKNVIQLYSANSPERAEIGNLFLRWAREYNLKVTLFATLIKLYNNELLQNHSYKLHNRDIIKYDPDFDKLQKCINKIAQLHFNHLPIIIALRDYIIKHYSRIITFEPIMCDELVNCDR